MYLVHCRGVRPYVTNEMAQEILNNARTGRIDIYDLNNKKYYYFGDWVDFMEDPKVKIDPPSFVEL